MMRKRNYSKEDFMAEDIMWRETENFSDTGETAELLEEDFVEENDKPEGAVRVYIQIDGTYSMETVIEKISAEVLGGAKLDVHSRRPEDGILTAYISYEQITAIQEVGGVASVELVEKAEQTEQEKSSKDEKETDAEKSSRDQKETDAEKHSKDEKETDAEKSTETGMQNSIPVSKIVGVTAVLLAVLILWAAVKSKGKRKGK